MLVPVQVQAFGGAGVFGHLTSVPERGFSAKKEGQGAQVPAALVPEDDCAERGCCCHQLWLPAFRLNVTSVGRALGMQKLVLSGDVAGSEVPFRVFKS